MGMHGVTGFRKAKLLGKVTGVFDCEYSDFDEEELSHAELREFISYEVEVQLADVKDAVFFGFQGKDSVRFNVSAESLWELTEGKPLATAYELFVHTQYGVWGTPMTADGRVQQLSRTALEAVRKHKLLNFEPADSGCEIAKLWLEAVTIKASNYLRQQEISDLLADCRRFKTEQMGIITQNATLDNYWLTAAQAGKRFITQRVAEMPSVCKLYESDSDSGVDMHVLGQILLKADNGSENVM